MKVTITGDLGSGKSTVAKHVSAKTGFDYISTGSIFRSLAKEAGMDVLEFNKLALTDKTIDDKVDGKLKEYNNYNKDILIDSRLAWYFIEDAHNLYFEVDLMEAAKRVFNDKIRTCEKEYTDILSAYNDLINRKKTENTRYQDRYGIDCNSINNYDIIINTTSVSIDEICKTFIYILKRLDKHEHVAKYWIPPTILYPTEDIRILGCDDAIKLRNNILHSGYNNDYSIRCVKVDGHYYIWDGHKRCSAAIINKVSLIPVEVIAIDEQLIYDRHSAKMFVEHNINKSRYYDWEDANSFLFNNYPTAKTYTE